MRMPLKIIMLIIVLILIASCASSDDYKKYRKFMSSVGTDYNTAEGKYRLLSEDEKFAVYLGANEMHPGDRRIANLAFCQDYDFIVRLRGVLEHKDDYVATYHFISEAEFEHCNKGLTVKEISDLNLPGLCRKLTAHSGTCLSALKQASQ